MKRSQQAITPHPPGQKTSASPAFGLQSGLFTPPTADTARALFAPLHYEPNYAYPLIVWLHGPGSDEWQLMRLMPLVSMRNYVAVAPRGVRLPREDRDGDVWGWSQSPEHIQEAEQRIFDSIDAVRHKYHISPHRIFLAGFDCGGTMAFRVAMQHPERFAGVLSIGGAFPTGQTPLVQWTRARHLAIFLGVGRDSPHYPPAAACEDLRLFHVAGMSVSLRQYPCGHQLAPQILGDVDRWIMEQITSTNRPSQKPDNRSACSPE